MKTREQLEKDINALVKLILSEMEQLAALDPVEASHPYHLEACRTKVIRRLWTVFKECLSYDPRGVV